MPHDLVRVKAPRGQLLLFGLMLRLHPASLVFHLCVLTTDQRRSRLRVGLQLKHALDPGERSGTFFVCSLCSLSLSLPLSLGVCIY